MATPRSTPSAGGFPIAIGAMAGAMIGFLAGEATIGFLVGVGLGIALAVLIWLRGRG